MKILVTVESYCAPGGGGIAEQVKQIAERLAALGNDVTVATSLYEPRAQTINGVHIVGFKISGNAVIGMEGDIEPYKDFLRQGGFDAMVNFAANVWSTDIPFMIVNDIPMKKVLSTPGMSMLNQTPAYNMFKSGLYFAWLRNLVLHTFVYRAMKLFYRQKPTGHGLYPTYAAYYQDLYVPALRFYDAIVYTSGSYQDKLFGDKNGLGDKAVVIPNGASEIEFLRTDVRPLADFLPVNKKRVIISVSNHYLSKGHAFVIDAFMKMKRADTVLLLIGQIPVGRGIKKLAHVFVGCYLDCRFASMLHRDVLVADGADREFVLSAYKHADLFLFGSQLECAPLVMYESFASKTPFITTDVGNVRDHKEYVRIVSTPAQMAREANRLLDDQDARGALADKAFGAWKTSYTWDAVSRQYDALVKELMRR